MNRRGFIGSIIGLVGSTNFLAKLITDPPQRVILPYKMTFVDSLSGFEIQAPGIEKIIEIKDGFQFVAEPLVTTASMRLDTAKLYTMDNELVNTAKFRVPLTMAYGDTLKATDNLHLAGAKAQTPEEMVQYFLKHNRGELNGIRV